VHRIRFQPGSSPDHVKEGSLQRSPDTLTGLRGPTSKKREDKRREGIEKMRGGEGTGGGSGGEEGRKRKGRREGERTPLTQIPGYAPCSASSI